MKILQLAPLWESVPPPAYGGTEAVVSALTEELIRRGHDVTLWASGDSQTSAHLRSISTQSLRTAKGITMAAPYEWLHAACALRDVVEGEYDLVHNHAGELPMAFAASLPVPMLSTMHCAITSDTRPIWDRYTGYYNTISTSQRETMLSIAGGTFAGAVYNGIDVESFPFSRDKEGYLLFLSRLSEEKAPHLAIQVARATGIPLILAGKVDWHDQDYFRRMVKDEIDGSLISFVGEADAAYKRELYQGAKCLLLPLMWDEPFGLVMVEALACGTPVVAFARGAAPELIEDGGTGFLVHSVEEMISAVQRVDQIDPLACREHVSRRFDVGQMADGYLDLYERMLEDAERSRLATKQRRSSQPVWAGLVTRPEEGVLYGNLDMDRRTVGGYRPDPPLR